MKHTRKHYSVLTLGLSFVLTAVRVPIYGQSEPAATGLVRAKTPIPNQYIVVLKQQSSGSGQAPDVAATAKEIALQYGGQPGAVYQHALHGFHVQMPEAQATALAKDSTRRMSKRTLVRHGWWLFCCSSGMPLAYCDGWFRWVIFVSEEVP